MTTPSQSKLENPGPNDPVEAPLSEISGVVMTPAPRGESEPEVYFEHFPRTSFSATQLSQRRKRMRRIVTMTLGGALLVLAAAGIRSAFRSHATKAPAAAVEETLVKDPPPAVDSEGQPASDEANTAGEPPENKAGSVGHHKTSLSHRPAKKPGAR